MNRNEPEVPPRVEKDRLERDWDAAVGRVCTEAAYREVANEINRSVGLPHRKCQEDCHAAACN